MKRLLSLRVAIEGIELSPLPGWQRDAACADSPPAWFFPEHRVSDADRARTICHGCSVRLECLVFGYAETAGVWGGTSPVERHEARRRGLSAYDVYRETARRSDLGAAAHLPV